MHPAKQQIGLKLPDRVAIRGLRDRKWPIRYDSIERLAIALDFISIVSAAALSAWLFGLKASSGNFDLGKYLGPAVLISVLFISVMKLRELYKPTDLLNFKTQFRTAFLAWIGVFLFLAATVSTFALEQQIAREIVISFLAIGFATLAVNRWMMRDILRRGMAERRFAGRKVVLLTDQSQKNDPAIIDVLADIGFAIEQHFVLSASDKTRNHEKTIARIIEYTRSSDIEEIVVGADPDFWPELSEILSELRVLPIPVNFVPTGITSKILRRPIREFGSGICIELQRGPLTSTDLILKRSIDVVVSGLALFALLPLLAIVAVAIKIDSPGPILFRQQRCGFNGRRFAIRKFRTMSVLEEGPAIVQAQLGDKRVTRLGTWLRRTSIDELPQLLNVLDGTMSLVGPRPHAVAHDNQFDKAVSNYAFRRRVKPGLTGWAQIKGCRGPTPTSAAVEERVSHDLWYIENWSFLLDLVILMKTPIEILRGRNAY